MVSGIGSIMIGAALRLWLLPFHGLPRGESMSSPFPVKMKRAAAHISTKSSKAYRLRSATTTRL